MITDTTFKIEVKRMHTTLEIPIISDRFYYDNVRQLFSKDHDDLDFEKVVSYIISTYRFKQIPSLQIWKDAISQVCRYNTPETQYKAPEPLSVDTMLSTKTWASQMVEKFAVANADEKGNSENVKMVHSIKKHRAEMLKQGKVKNRKTGEWVFRSQMIKGESYTNYRWFVLQRNDIASALDNMGIILESENIIFG